MIIRILSLSLVATVLLSAGCLHPKSSQPENLPSTNVPVEIIPQASTKEQDTLAAPQTSQVGTAPNTTTPIKAAVVPTTTPPCLKRCSFDNHSVQGQCFMSDGVRWWGDHDYAKLAADPQNSVAGNPAVFNVNKIRLDTQTVNGQKCAYEIPHPWRQDLKRAGIPVQ
jgi:hypothetical protein